jgi:hypothetical protein
MRAVAKIQRAGIPTDVPLYDRRAARRIVYAKRKGRLFEKRDSGTSIAPSLRDLDELTVRCHRDYSSFTRNAHALPKLRPAAKSIDVVGA